MATLGNVPAEAYTNTVKDSFSGNGSTTAFTMSLPTVTNDVRVVVENVIQDPTVAYSVSGTTLTFTSAPPSGTNNIYVVHLGPAVMTTVPPAEIADATTFASSLTVQGAFTSKGIDDNADATAMTITSDEDVLISTTNINPHQDGSGIALKQNAGVLIGVDGTHAIIAARHNSDGEVIRVQKDNTTVGSIGIQSTGFYIDGESGHAGVRFSGSALIPRDNGSDSNGVNNLGSDINRFKDLYLSGGVYLGGTGAANKLSDVETGTWTPTVVFSGGGSPIYARQLATYTKIGRFVFCDISIIFQKNNCSGNLSIENFPFSNTSGNDRGCASFGYFSGLNGIPIGMIGSGNAKCDIRTALNSTSYNDDLNGNAHITNGFLDAETNFHFSITYKTS
tara:strand:+ start:1194 stop:2369 length:1176 start_codon:yes stop_codon:yes gene_type:complete